MLSDKEIKKKYKPVFWKTPDKFYPTEVLKEEGFTRNICNRCKKPFWGTDPDRKYCGDPACSEGESFAFIGKSPAKKQLDYVQVWQDFSKMFKRLGYTPVKRYPVVARWNPTMEYTNASIAAFQPFVISGEVKPPANPLVIPQFCLRFSDIDNVGISQAHNTGFCMIGQHMFVKPKDWDQNKVFRDIHMWLKKGLGLPNEEVTFHEDAWAGGGNLGCCMEFFSRGCEIGNQVYMLYEQTPKGVKELDIKVLDMGMGQERNAWFSQGTSSIYDATFPTVVKKLTEATGIKIDKKLMQKFVPYAGMLNIDEVEDINKTWKIVAKNVGIDVKELREKVLPLSGLYSIAEHSRSLLISLNDGALPSNVGGGYNLRILLRRALAFIDQFDWNLYLPDICEWHAAYLKKLWPELSENLDDVQKILDVEKSKYKATRQKAKQLISRVIKKKVDEKMLLQLYDSEGISPELIREEAVKMGKKVAVPDNFYARVSEMHEKKEQASATEREEYVEAGDLPETEALYYFDYTKLKFKGKVLKVIGQYVILDKTIFYPVSGGQMADEGSLNKERVVDVFKQGKLIIHKMAKKPKFKKGDTVSGEVDWERRKQLTQHHTSTHIVNAAARRVLGSHINQASAKKDMEKGYLDVTHYELINEEDLEKIEQEANKIVDGKIPIHLSFMPRDEAEKKYGVTIYQGGAVPGKKIRIVDIPSVDVEACGGTHLNNTSEAGKIKIIKATKVKDGVVRLIFSAGKAAENLEKKASGLVDEVGKILGVKAEQIPGRALELFQKWKKARKAVNKGKKVDVKELELVSTEEYDGDVLSKAADNLKTQVEHLPKVLKRFLKELEEFKEKLS